MTTTYGRMHTGETNPTRAVDALLDQMGTDAPAVLFLFVDLPYDLDALADALTRRVRGPVLACSSAGRLTSDGYASGGFGAAWVLGDELQVQAHTIEDVAAFDVHSAERTVAELRLDAPSACASSARFGVLLIDGMSFAEERVAALLHGASQGMPVVGGSAADPAFERCLVFDGARFRSNCAVLGVVESAIPFEIFRFQHFDVSAERAVVTEADVPKRRILGIDGEPAVEAYKRLLRIDTLTPAITAKHPLMLKISEDQYFARGIRSWTEDALELFCAIDPGMVISVGDARDLVQTLDTQLAGLRPGGRDVGLTIAFDCIQRRLEVEGERSEAQLRDVMADKPVLGFSTFGEQYGGMHINQTMTGIALAA